MWVFLLNFLVCLISRSSKHLVDLGQLSSTSFLGLGPESLLGLLLLVESLTLGTTLVLKRVNKFLVLPSNIVGKVLHDSVVPSGLKTDGTKGSGDDLALHLVIGVGDTLEGAKTSNGSLSTGSLLVNHTTDGPPDNPGRGLEVEGTTRVVGVHTLGTELGVLGLVADKGSRDDHLFATDKDDLLSGEEFLGHDGAEASVHVVTAVDEDGLFENHGWI